MLLPVLFNLRAGVATGSHAAPCVCTVGVWKACVSDVEAPVFVCRGPPQRGLKRVHWARSPVLPRLPLLSLPGWCVSSSHIWCGRDCRCLPTTLSPLFWVTRVAGAAGPVLLACHQWDPHGWRGGAPTTALVGRNTLFVCSRRTWLVGVGPTPFCVFALSLLCLWCPTCFSWLVWWVVPSGCPSSCLLRHNARSVKSTCCSFTARSLCTTITCEQAGHAGG